LNDWSYDPGIVKDVVEFHEVGTWRYNCWLTSIRVEMFERRPIYNRPRSSDRMILSDATFTPESGE